MNLFTLKNVAVVGLVTLAVAVNAQAPKSTKGTVSTASKSASVAFTPVFWQSDLSANKYFLNEPAKVFAWVKLALTENQKSLPKAPDVFSTKEEREHYQAALEANINTFSPIPMQVDCTRKYSPDSQSYEFKIRATPVAHFLKDGEISKPSQDIPKERLALRRIKLVGSDNFKVDKKYQASNAYGKTVEVTEYSATEYIVTTPSGASSEPSDTFKPSISADSITRGMYMLSMGDYILSGVMSPAQAREVDKEIACLAVVKLMPPSLVYGGDVSTPTIDKPTKVYFTYHGFLGLLDRILVVNKSTGAVYAEAQRPGI